MNELMNWIYGSSTELTPESMLRLFLFMLLLEMISRLCGSFASLGKR